MYEFYLTLSFHLIPFQHLMVVPMVVTLDGTLPGLTQHEIQLTHSHVQEEWKAEVLSMA